jgi:hypothetical protein
MTRNPSTSGLTATLGSTLLDKILADAKPYVGSADAKYDISSRPTELSSGGYADYAGDAD